LYITGKEEKNYQIFDCRSLVLDISLFHADAAEAAASESVDLSVCLFVRSIYSSTNTAIGMLGWND